MTRPERRADPSDSKPMRGTSSRMLNRFATLAAVCLLAPVALRFGEQRPNSCRRITVQLESSN
ncbi:hypothetical protein, partial [Mycolicibacterium fortuitum]|uniref:hypothetical protein n=1 Tax=Mycolicibacterium fortuitum TaxID=1766 RepID=UPI001A96165C